MESLPTLERLLRRDRAVTATALLLLAGLAWVSLVRMRAEMDGGASGMAGMAMPTMESWSALELFQLFLMWATMMVAMMAPSAAPMVLTFALVNRWREERSAPYVPAAVFLLGYMYSCGPPSVCSPHVRNSG